VGIAGRIGLSARSAFVGGLLFASLPLVAIQAPTAYNDLVVASFLVIAAYASIGRGRSDLVLLTLAIALALSTKFTGILALPVLALVAGAANPVRRWPALVGAGLAGIALGSPWYIVNRVETGHFDGALTDATAQVQERTLIAIAPTIRRELYSSSISPGPRRSTCTVAALAVHHDRGDLRTPRLLALSLEQCGESEQAGRGAASFSVPEPRW
jgi:hypothetical protein